MPAVLRFSNGQSGHAEIRVLSLTGGLLTLPRCIHHGARVKLMFLLETGAVLSPIELLRPVNWTQQPFRFLDLELGDERRLQTMIQSAIQQPATAAPRLTTAGPVNFHPPKTDSLSTAKAVVTTSSPTRHIQEKSVPPAMDEAWITRYRENLDQRKGSRKRPLATILGAIGLSLLCICSAAYVYTCHWK